MNGLDKQVKNGPSLTEALENAGIFYEAQYKEVKVVANVSPVSFRFCPKTRRLSVKNWRSWLDKRFQKTVERGGLVRGGDAANVHASETGFLGVAGTL